MQIRRTFGFWALIIFSVFLLVMILVGQTGCLINYNFAVMLNLQEAEHVITPFGVAMNKGFAFADTCIYVPFLLLGMIGLWFKKTWGLFCMLCTLGITAYWPIACLAMLFFAKNVPGFYFTNYFVYTVLLGSFSILAICGVIYLYRSR